MPKNEGDPRHLDFWKSQEDDPMPPAATEIRTKARKYERESILVHRAVLVAMPLLAAAFLYNLIRLGQPLLVMGAGFGLATVGLILWKAIGNPPARITPAEPCLVFLRNECERKRLGLIWVRNCTLLLIPAIGFSWWGGGPIQRAKALGIQSPAVLDFLGGPALLAIMALVLGFIWFALSKQAGKHRLERQHLDHLAPRTIPPS